MYGNEKYGTVDYADSATGRDENECYIDLIKLIPEFVSEMREMHELYTVQGYEAGFLRKAMEDIINQCFIATATWSLTRWEQLFDIKTNLSLTYEQRREILTAKICGQGTTTVQMIKDTAAAFSGGDVEVKEDNAHHRFVVQFIGVKGIPRNMQGFISMLEEIKPAHLTYEFLYRYTIWNELKSHQWNGLYGISWDELRVLENGSL